MSTQANSNRTLKYSRLGSSGRRTSISEYQPKQTFKLAAIRSVNKGVKYNDLSFITGSSMNKLRAEQGHTGGLEYVSTHENLTNIRKKHDQTKRQRIKREKDLESVREQLAKLKQTEQQYYNKKDEANQLTSQLQKSIATTKLLLDEAYFQQKSMVNITQRMKHDRVVFDQRKFNLEKELKFLKKQLEIVSRQQHVVGEEADRTKKVYEKLVKQLDAENKQRDEHLQNIQNSIATRMELKDNIHGRQLEMADIAQRAMQDKDENQKKWKKLLTVHKFVSSMLRDKMEREMTKFKVVETAFKNIKIATGTSDTIDLVNKFLNKETVYGQLLSKIADSEKKIESFKLEHEELWRQRKHLQDQLNLFENTRKVNNDLTRQFKEMETTEERSKKTELISQKMYYWVLKQLRKIYKRQGKGKPTKYTESQTKQAMEELFVWLQTNCDKANQSYTDVINPQSLTKSDVESMMRVRIRKEEEQQGDEPDSTAVEEQEYVAQVRNEVQKNNQKFLKEVRRKAEALAKLRAEMATKKKEDSPPPKQGKVQKIQQ